MRVHFTKGFLKQYKKLKAQQEVVERGIALFLDDSRNQQIQTFSLRGKYGSYQYLRLDDTLRAVYGERGGEVISFVALGTENDLFT